MHLERDNSILPLGMVPRRELNGNLGNNIRSLLTEIDIDKIDERKKLNEDLKRITSIEIQDPFVEKVEKEQLAHMEIKRIISEIEQEIERLISTMD